MSNSVTQKSIQDNLIEIVELNVDEIEFYEEKNYRKELHMRARIQCQIPNLKYVGSYVEFFPCHCSDACGKFF